jgi:hypothetical protein
MPEGQNRAAYHSDLSMVTVFLVRKQMQKFAFA